MKHLQPLSLLKLKFLGQCRTIEISVTKKKKKKKEISVTMGMFSFCTVQYGSPLLHVAIDDLQCVWDV